MEKKFYNKSDRKKWLLDAKQQDASFVLFVYDVKNYPPLLVYVQKWENVVEIYDDYLGPNRDREIHVYDLNLDLDMQLKQENPKNLPKLAE